MNKADVIGIAAGAASALAFLSWLTYANAGDPRIASTSEAEVCATDGRPGSSYSRTHRKWDDKRGTLAKAGIPWSDRALYEDDDSVPVCLGGNNLSPANHRAQLWAEAHIKDAVERAACIAVCRDHSMSLHDAQAIFLGDWRNNPWGIGR